MTEQPERKRKLKSLVASRFDIQLPVLLLFAAFIVAAAIFLFREIAADRLRITSGAQPIYFTSPNAEGLGFGSELKCQGLTVGRVRAVLVDEKGTASGRAPSAPIPADKVGFRIQAALDKPYANWVFQGGPVVRAKIGPAYLGLSSIELELAEVRPPEEKLKPQQLELRVEEGRFGRMQDDASLLLESVVRRADLLGERVKSGEATSVERTLWNVDRFTEKLDAAVTKLTVDAGRPSPLSRLVDSVDRLSLLVDDLGKQVKDLTAESAATVQRSRAAIEKLEATVSGLERSSLEVLGETPAQRRAIRAELLETLRDFRQASSSFKDLTSRVGDTGVGRMIIKKKENEPAPSNTPASPRKSQ